MTEATTAAIAGAIAPSIGDVGMAGGMTIVLIALVLGVGTLWLTRRAH